MHTPPQQSRVLLLGFGNPGRLDDGLGPALADTIAEEQLPGVTVLSDYQLSPEHAADIAAHHITVFADAAVGGRSPFALRRLLPRPAESFTSHATRPEALLALARDCFGFRGEAYLLAIRGYAFNDYDERLSGPARENLLAAAQHLTRALRTGRLAASVTDDPTDTSAADPAHNAERPIKEAQVIHA